MLAKLWHRPKSVFVVVGFFRNIVENDENNDDADHVFLKRVCNVLTLLGQTQLAVVWVRTVPYLNNWVICHVKVCTLGVPIFIIPGCFCLP